MIAINDEDIIKAERLLDVEFDVARRAAIKTFDDVQACPGSGKTTMVAAKLLILANKWNRPYQGVCVLTHTNVAKNEIIERLKANAYGKKLLSYPHFIGTIQEFVNKFIALPYLRSGGFSINTIDDEICASKGWYYLKPTTKAFLERKRITSLFDFKYRYEDNALKLTIPGFPNGSTSNSCKDLESVKNRLLEEGYFYFDEMYAFACDYLHCNPSIINAVRKRFPVVLIDEMQDTQKFQDELLNQLFSDNSVCMQRFGDPDQAIYSGNGDENQTYNNENLEKIENSHRFDNSIALLAQKLSYNQINLHSGIEPPEHSQHTIYLVDEATRSNVSDAFIDLCADIVPEEARAPIKIVGAVGISKDEGLTINSYVASYKKNHSTNSFKPEKLIHYIYESKKFNSIARSYSLILDGIVKCGKISNSELTFTNEKKECYSVSNIRKYLKHTNQYINFNMMIKSLISDDINEENWTRTVQDIKNFLNMNSPSNLASFLTFDNPHVIDEHNENPNKLKKEILGRQLDVEVSTIHAVKGETHAATLVLETKNHQFDIGKLINHILGDTNDKPTGVRVPKFMKQLYVAFSRPQHLLCIAIDISRFPQEHIEKNTYGGWKIVNLTNN